MHDLIQRLLASYQHSLQSGGYLYIVFLMALESSVIPLPSELVIPPAVLLVDAGRSSMSLPGIVLAAAIGSLLGASIMYWGSRVAGRPLVVRYGSLMLVPMERVERAERWAEKSGAFGTALARALSVFRHAIGLLLITPDKIERAVNTIAGIDELRSVSTEGVSQVFIVFKLEKSVDVAAQEVRDKVNQILPDLPQDIDQPVVDKMDPDAAPVITATLPSSRPAMAPSAS